MQRSATKAVVIGGGSWGTAFARILVQVGVSTELVCRRSEQAQAINSRHRNPDYLRNIDLPPRLTAVTLAGSGLAAADLVVISIPSKVYRSVVREVAAGINPQAAVLNLTKGLEPGSLKRLSQVLIEELPQPAAARVAVLSGPNHAEEIALDVPAATTIAALDFPLAQQLQELISTKNFRVYINQDLIGVELCAATKNVIALAAGLCDGLGFGDNAKGALITRGLAEMSRLGARLGAEYQTFAGLAGMGDLIATCTSRFSRNRLAGELIAQGCTPVEAEEEMGMVAEGLTSAASVLALAQQHGVEMPITEQVCAVIYDGKNVKQAVAELMNRSPRAE